MTRIFLAIILLLASPALAHELRPAYLELQETGSGEYNVLWKTPARGDLRLALRPEFSGRTEILTPITRRQSNNTAVQTWRMRTVEPLRGQSLRIDGLDGTMTDVLVRLQFADGGTWMKRLTAAAPASVIPAQPNGLQVASDYLKMGIEHILLGIDHLLFVLALILLIQGCWKLVKAITAFTVAHSITLAMVTLGFVRVPSGAVEAIIALSIVFLAAETVYAQRGRESITTRAPWVVAFAFGLLHGCGFASALSDAGLPDGHLPLALLFFNLGVEVGQLLFIAVILTVRYLVRHVIRMDSRPINVMLAYCMGSFAMFWVFQRVTSF